MATLGALRDRLLTLSRGLIQVWDHSDPQPLFELDLRPYTAELSGFTDALGASYLLSPFGVHRLGPDYALQLVGAVDSGRGSALTGPPDGDGRRDLFLATPDGRVEHFDGSAWTRLAPGGLEPLGIPSAGAAWLRPQTALLTGTGSNGRVVVVSNGRLREERVFEPGPSDMVLGGAAERIRGAEYVGALGGVVVYSSGGRAWLREGVDRYVALELGEPQPTGIRSIVATDRGFVAAANDELIEYDAVEGACASRHTGVGELVITMRAGPEGRVEILSGAYASFALTGTAHFQLVPESSADEACD